MAALTWRNVEAPNLDVRGLALATQGVTGGLDQLSQLFMNRELEARKQATDGAIAESLRIQDPQQLAAALASGQIGAADPRGRVDQRAVLEAANAQRSNLISTGLQNENLLNSQAQAEFGTRIAGLRRAAEAGDPAAQQAYQAEMEANPEFGRVALEAEQQRSAGFGLFEGRQRKDTEFAYGQQRDEVSDNQWQQKFNADRAAEAARLSLQRRELESRESERGNAGLAVSLGRTLAAEYGGNVNRAMRDERVEQLKTPQQLAAFEATFNRYGEADAAPTATTQKATEDFDARIGGKIAAATTAAAGARNQAIRTPAAQAIQYLAQRDTDRNLAQESGQPGPATPEFEEVRERVDGVRRGPDAGWMRQKMADGYTLAEIDAAARFQGDSAWYNPRVNNINDRFDNTLKEMRTLRDQGGFAKLGQQADAAAAGYERAIAGVDRVKQRIIREMNLSGETELTSRQRERLEKAEAELDKRLNSQPAALAPVPAPTSSGPLFPGLRFGPGGGKYPMDPLNDPYLRR